MANREGRRRWTKVVIGLLGAIIIATATIVAEKLRSRGRVELSTIQGVVTDNYGDPVAGAVVEIDGLSATTDAGGTYLIGNVPAGIRTLRAGAPDTEVVERPLRVPQGGEIIKVDIILPRREPPSLKITYPRSGDKVRIRETVKGTSKHIPKEQGIWIVLYCHEVSRYYPADRPADRQPDGEWTSPVFIGIEGDVGKEHDIIAVLAGKETQDAFNRYLEQCEKEESWPGQERLPKDAVEHDRVTVVRQ